MGWMCCRFVTLLRSPAAGGAAAGAGHLVDAAGMPAIHLRDPEWQDRGEDSLRL